MASFDVSQTKATLGLTLYVLAYGIGPMFLAPLQEMPSIGRNPVYIIGLALFLLFNVPIVAAKNFSTVLAFRFLSAFVGSPALATGVCTFALAYALKLNFFRFRVHPWGTSSQRIASLM